MPLRARAGNWHYRFEVNGHEYTGSTELPATERNRTAANRKEAAARELVVAGKAHELRLEVIPFSEAAGMFLDWCASEHRDKPNTTKRLRVSFTALVTFFKRSSVVGISAGEVEAFKTFRRTINGVRDVTLRHDLHALSKFFKFARKHNWCKANPVEDVEIPSDADAVRIHVLTAAAEAAYFEAIDELALGAHLQRGKGFEGQKAIAKRQYGMLRDLARIMLNQGARPSEVMAMRTEHVNGNLWRIPDGKSRAARRTLKLTAASAALLEFRRAESRSGWMFPALRAAGPMTSMQDSHDAACERSGCSFVLYDLRHTFATRAALTMPITTLAAVLGYGNLRSVMKYIHPQAADIAAGMDAFEAATAGESKIKAVRI